MGLGEDGVRGDGEELGSRDCESVSARHRSVSLSPSEDDGVAIVKRNNGL